MTKFETFAHYIDLHQEKWKPPGETDIPFTDLHVQKM